MRLSEYIEKSGMPAQKFAERIGVSAQVLSRYVRGQRIPRPEQMRRIIEATNGAVQPTDFYSGQLDADTEAA